MPDARPSPYVYDERPGGTHQVVLSLVPPGGAVLDVGCNRGYLGRALHARGCRLWGIDRDEQALQAVPAGTYVDVAAVDLDAAGALPWPEQLFDAILAADILEHLREPQRVLSLLVSGLSPQGRIIVSLPNIAHVSVRMQLARGRFEYQDSGILDRTHLHFYTFDSALALVRSAGLEPAAVLAGSDHFGLIVNRHPAVGRLLRSLVAYNVIIDARRPGWNGQPGTAPSRRSTA